MLFAADLTDWFTHTASAVSGLLLAAVPAFGLWVKLRKTLMSLAKERQELEHRKQEFEDKRDKSNEDHTIAHLEKIIAMAHAEIAKQGIRLSAAEKKQRRSDRNYRIMFERNLGCEKERDKDRAQMNMDRSRMDAMEAEINMFRKSQGLPPMIPYTYKSTDTDVHKPLLPGDHLDDSDNFEEEGAA